MSAAGPPAPGAPVLLTSLSAAALLDGRGDLELLREMRGTPVDWGGVFGQCVRLTGPWRVALSADGEDRSLPACFVSSERAPGGWRSLHRWNGFEVVQDVAAVGPVPGVVRTFRCSVTGKAPPSLTLTSTFAPYLLPVLVEGIRPHTFRADTGSDEVRVRQRGFALSVRWTEPPTRLFLNRGSWIGGRFRGRLDELGVEFSVPLAPGATSELSLLVSGGLDRTLDASALEARAVLSGPREAAAAVDGADRAWVDATPSLRFPDSPLLERGYRVARSALRRLYTAPGDGLTGLVAGYPWYSAIWCRDLAWMLRSVLWMGDFEWAERSIATVLRFQSRSEVPILGGETGELPMQISPGPVFFYGTSDTTLYYPLLIDDLHRHAGGTGPSEEWKQAVRRMIVWGEARTDPTSGLLRNGGEVEAISTATQSLARVRYGIDSPDTTIWDSTDRRDHAIDIQVLWWRALGAAGDILGGPRDPAARRMRELADRLAGTLRARYAWDAEGYLYDSYRAGRPVEQVRPNALRAVGAGLFPPAPALRFVERAAQDDLTSPWGVRTLSSRDAAYDPIAYHDGQVWTIATAWAADAALAVGAVELGLGYLSTIADRLDREGGFANECYRGDRAEPFDSCFLLGFSVAPFLTLLFERLWGLTVDARAGRLTVRPAFPPHWHAASLERLRIGPGSVALDWTPERLRVRWSGPGPLSVVTGSGDVTVAPGSERDVSTVASG
ncbi:MAG: amylo-alpha-1,6-glucosidase [Thermoplasmata archaeon]